MLFALTTTHDLPEGPDVQESLSALQQFIKTASPVVLSALWHIALALVIFLAGRWLIEKFLSRVALLDNKTKIDPGVAKFVRSLVRVALWALLIYFIADFLGVPTASFAALRGSLCSCTPLQPAITSRPLRTLRAPWWKSGCFLPPCG